MRTRRAVLLVLAGGVLAAAAAAGASGSVVPQPTAYRWAQPGAAPVTAAQPPAWIPVATAPARNPAVPTFAWPQPGSAPVSVPTAEPTR